MEMVVAKKILTIDDDPIFLRLVDQVLSHQGFEVLKAGGGQEGLRLLFTEKPDIVLLDVVMPKMNGEEVMMAMKDINPNPCILFASGYSPMGVHTSFILEKNYNLIQKPYSPAQLLDQIRNLLD